MTAFPGIQSCSDYGNNLLADNQFNEEEKNKIKQEIESLGQRFQILQKDINDEQDRSEMVQHASFIFLVLTFQWLEEIFKYKFYLMNNGVMKRSKIEMGQKAFNCK